MYESTEGGGGGFIDFDKMHGVSEFVDNKPNSALLALALLPWAATFGAGLAIARDRALRGAELGSFLRSFLERDSATSCCEACQTCIIR